MSNIFIFFKKHWKPIYADLTFTALVFIPMILLSYFVTLKIVNDYMVTRAENMVVFERMKIEADLLEPYTALGIFSEAVQDMIMNGDNGERLRQFFAKQSDYHYKNKETRSSYYLGFYGYFESLINEPVFINGNEWSPSDDFIPSQRPWYQAAAAAHGEIGESYPYIDCVTGKNVFTYSRCIYNDKGQMLGIVCLDVQIDKIGKYVVETSLSQGGYGILLSQDLYVLAHPYEPFIGKHLDDPRLPISIFSDELNKGEEINERTVVSFDNKDSISFFKRLSNGWYLGIVVPKSPFSHDLKILTIGLSMLGALFATILIFMIIRLEKARGKSVMESRHKSVFLANMSHEMRTPMNAIIGMTAIGKNENSVERKDYCLSKIDEASRHLLGVINDILDMSKIEANKLYLSVTEFNFEKMIQRTVSVVNYRVNEKQLKLKINIDSAIPKTLIGDDQRLAQVITNLLGNAVKFTDENGYIILDAVLLNEKPETGAQTPLTGSVTIQITVKDSGIGMSAEQQVNIFDSFQQADINMTRKYGGTGLGLAISKNIVEMMEGNIWVQSKSGIGSTFGFTVKLKRCEDKNADSGSLNMEENKTNSVNNIFTGRRILLAEDVDINREIVIELLKPTDINIDCAENGIAAVRMFRENSSSYDLIFMDLQMPRMDGITATRYIRELNISNAKTIPIIAMTANVFSEDIKNCIDSGMNGHIGKPFSVDEIMEILKMYINQ